MKITPAPIISITNWPDTTVSVGRCCLTVYRRGWMVLLGYGDWT